MPPLAASDATMPQCTAAINRVWSDFRRYAGTMATIRKASKRSRRTMTKEESMITRMVENRSQLTVRHSLREGKPRSADTALTKPRLEPDHSDR